MVLADSCQGASPEAIADRVRRSLRCQVPVDVAEVARSLGASIDLSDILTGSGCLLPSGRSYHILLKSSDSSHRQRFTIGHEIGHILHSKGELQARTKRHGDVETACNRFAAALLVPSQNITADLHRSRNFADALVSSARKFAVSREVVALRLKDLGMPLATIFWRAYSHRGGKTALRVAWSSAPGRLFIPKFTLMDKKVKLYKVSPSDELYLASLRLGDLRGMYTLHASWSNDILITSVVLSEGHSQFKRSPRRACAFRVSRDVTQRPAGVDRVTELPLFSRHGGAVPVAYGS